MSQAPKPRGLGRGLSALLGDADVAAAVAPPPAPPAASAEAAPVAEPPSRNRAPMTLPTSQLRAGKSQPRTVFEGIDHLADSVKQFGLLQPILVRPLPGERDSYEIIAGERRWRAAQKAQLHEVPVVVRSLDDVESLQLALIENLQRTDLTAIDEANGYQRLIDLKQTQEDIARLMGKSRPHVGNTLRLLDLPAGVQELVQDGTLSAGQGRALLSFPDPMAMARRTVAEKLTVRDLEALAEGERLKGAPRGKKGASESKSGDVKALEKRIEEALGLKASLSSRGGEKTTLSLDIDDYDQLDSVVDKLTRR
jgi:ParB family chromosome partitioning protein